MSAPALGSVVTVQLFEGDAPVEGAFETSDAYQAALATYEARQKLKLKVRMVGREPVRAAAYEEERLEIAEKLKLREMREKYPVEEWPDLQLHRDGYITEEGSRALVKHMRGYVMDIVVGLCGLDIEGMDIDSERDPAAIADVLDQFDLLPFAYYRVLAANKPSVSQLF